MKNIIARATIITSWYIPALPQLQTGLIHSTFDSIIITFHFVLNISFRIVLSHLQRLNICHTDVVLSLRHKFARTYECNKFKGVYLHVIRKRISISSSLKTIIFRIWHSFVSIISCQEVQGSDVRVLSLRFEKSIKSLPD